MKKSIIFIASLIAMLFVFSSCTHRLVGVWKVASYETSQVGESGSTFTDIGTITFDKDGTGQKNISYTLIGTTVSDRMPFNWSVNGIIVNIDGQQSDFVKSWIIIDNKPTYQKWKSTDGSNIVQTIELKKEKK
jgi:type 1 fimbria pilin